MKGNPSIKYPAKTVFLVMTVFIILLFCQVPALAQQYISQDGHFIDANPRIGSLGINPNARLDALIPRINDLYITGNVTGGASFQGGVPYQNINEFSGTLGSSTLSNFRRDSVGSGNLTTGINLPRPYLDLSRSITRLEGQNVITTHELFNLPSTVASLPETAPLTSLGQMSTSNLDQPDFSMRIKTPLPDEFDARRFEYQYFDIESAELPEWMIEPLDTESSPLTPYQPRVESALQEGLRPEDLRISPLHRDENFPLESELIEGAQTARDQTMQSKPSDSSFMEDVYSLPTLTPDTETADESANENADLSPSDSLFHSPVNVEIDVSALPSEKSAFAERSRQQFDYHMRRGEMLMRRGDYFLATNTYDVALIYNFRSAPAHRAKAHALFATGEYMSSAFYLNKALLLDPAQARNQVDIQRLFAHAEDFQKRLADLAYWQETSGQPLLSLLYGYILYQNGSLEQAKTALTKARAAKGLATSVDYLLDAIANPDKISDPATDFSKKP